MNLMRRNLNSVVEYERMAQRKVEKDSYGYFISGSDDQVTLKNNVESFNKIYLAPRILRDMTKFSMSTRILGQKVKIPFGIAPFAMQKLVHPEGEAVTARQANKFGTAFGLSISTTVNLTKIAQENGTGLRILQLYFMKNAEVTLEVIRLAQNRGFKALAITVDTQVMGKRRRDERAVFQPQASQQLWKQLGRDFVLRDEKNKERSMVHQFRNDLSWDDIKWIKKNTYLKIILKGIISPRDVSLAEECGVDALWVSNHGGRQLDTSPATIISLPMMRRKLNEIGSKMELYIDGGIRKGSDIFKCLALGADFVFLGRPFVFALTDGDEGVGNVFSILKEELRRTMMLCGVTSVQDINKQYILKYPQAKL